MLKLSERRLKSGILLYNYNKEGETLGVFLPLHNFGVFRVSRSWDISRFANLPFITCLGEKDLMKSYKKSKC